MPTSVPPGFVADASLRVWWVPTIANPAAPTVAELNHATAVDATCYFTAGFAPDAAVATITDDRLCLAVVLEDKGVSTWSIPEYEAIYDVQNPASISNKLYAATVENAVGFYVARYGMSVDTAPATGQKVDVFPSKCGPRPKLPPERNTKGRFKQKVFVNGVPNIDVSVA